MQVGVNVTCMHTNFGGCSFSNFGDIATFKNGQISLLTMDYSPWSAKNLIDWNQLKKLMQVGIDVTCMHTNLVSGALSVSEIFLLSKTAKFPFLTIWTIAHGQQKI